MRIRVGVACDGCCCLLDQVAYRWGVGYHREVGCSDLYHGGAGALCHEELSPRWDRQVNCSDKIPGRDGPPCWNSGLFCESAERKCALSGSEDCSLAGREIVGEARGEETLLDVGVNAAGCQWDEVEDLCRVSCEAGGGEAGRGRDAG